MAVISDIIEGSLRNGPDGIQATRAFIVTDVAGNAAGRMYEALLAPNVPRRGDAHPVVPNINLIDIDVSALGPSDPGKFQISLTYRRPDIADLPPSETGRMRIEMSTVTTQDQTWFDADGNLMTVRFTGFVTADADAPGLVNGFSTGDQTQFVQADAPRQLVRVKLERYEPNPPIEKSLELVNHTNRVSFGGRPQDTWYVEEITSQEINRGEGYMVGYSLIYDPQTWLVRGEWLFLGRIPEAATLGNGIELFRIYDRVDLNQYSLTVTNA